MFIFGVKNNGGFIISNKNVSDEENISIIQDELPDAHLSYDEILTTGCSRVHATDLPAVNLGSTTFYGGAPVSAGPGWYTSLFMNHYDGHKMTDNTGQHIPLPSSTMAVDTVTLQMLYQGEGGAFGQ